MGKKDALFVPRCSYLDSLEPNSWINKNELRGFYVMFNFVSAFYIICTCGLHFERDGFFINGSFFHSMMADFKVIIVLWPCFFLWSWMAFALQLLVLKGFPRVLTIVIQHVTQSMMFLCAWYLVFSRDWGFSQTVFVTFLALVHFMKMHSFTLVNRDLRAEWLKSPSTCTNTYPSNITVQNFFDYMVCPVLVYQTSYPRTPKFRWGYFLAKTLLYIIVEDNIIPVIQEARNVMFFECFVGLMLPLIFFDLLFFEIVFEDILNLFAEIGRFADREFYRDWWNSAGWAEYNRKWNRPVHLFLYMHVYKECIDHFHWPEPVAKFITFLFSGLCHEMVIALVLKVVKPYLMAFMLLQIPLMAFLAPATNSKPGMYMFWSGLCAGPPLILTLYLQW